MINDIARKSINVDAPNNVPVAQIKEYDDFILKLALMKYNTPFDCTGQTATLGVKAPSGLFEQTTDITINKDQIDIELKTGIISKAGTCAMELKLADSTGSMTTASFFIVVNRKILNDEAVEASDEFDSLTEAKKMEPIRQENELKRQENEKGRVEAEKLRVQAETDRAEAEERREQQELARQTCYKEIEESREDFDGGIHKNLKLRLMRDFGDIYERFNEANLLPYEAEYISASNSYKGMTKDLIIKGRTLQNLQSIYKKGTYPLQNSSNSEQITYQIFGGGLFKSETKYTVILSIVECKNSPEIYINCTGDVATDFKFTVTNNGIYKILLNTPSNFNSTVSTSNMRIPLSQIQQGKIATFDYCMILEGDYTNKPIPSYFWGIKSVNEESDNMEVVSCGKNLFDESLPVSSISTGVTYEKLKNGFKVVSSAESAPYSAIRIKIPIDRFLGRRVTCYADRTQTGSGAIAQIMFQTTSGEYKYYDFSNAKMSIDFPTAIKDDYLTVQLITNNTSTPNVVNTATFTNIQFEYADTKTEYEPYKEDRLPIKIKNLRGLPNGTCDTSDGVRRVEKIIIDGSQDIKLESINANGIANFYIILTQLGTSVAICDKLLIDNSFIANAIREGFIIVNSNTLYIRILSSKVSTVTAAKLYFKNNPHTFYYELATPTKEEGNTEQLRTYDRTTNIFTENSLIEPKISCKVPSNVQAVVMNLRSENEALNNDVNTIQATTEENNLMNIETNVNQEARLTMLELGVI